MYGFLLYVWYFLFFTVKVELKTQIEDFTGLLVKAIILKGLSGSHVFKAN